MKYLLTVLLSVIAYSLAAQETVSVTGFVVDKQSAPVEGATIRALTADSVFLSGTTTNTKGHFILKLAPTKCLIEITCLGYQKLYKPVTVGPSAKVCDLDTIALPEESICLDEVMVKGRAAAMQMKGDTLEYNAGIYTLPEQATVRDLLKLLPNVTVTDKGQIMVQGKAVSKILVDGKEFFSNDPGLASKSLPGKIVEKVQVIEQSSEAERMSGFESGDKETVLNLAIKEENKVGATVQATAGGGHDIKGDKARYGQEAFANLLKREDMFGIVADHNNTNHNSGGMISGENSTSTVGATINNTINEKLTLSATGMYNVEKRLDRTQTDKQTILSSESSLYESSNSASENKSKNLFLNARTEWKPDDKNTLIVDASFIHLRNKVRNDGRFNSLNGVRDTLYNGNSVAGIDGKNYSLEVDVDYARRFKKKGRVLSTSFNGSINQGDSEDSYTWNRRNFESNIFVRDSLVNQQAMNENTDKEFKWRLSYVEPVGKNGFMQLAYTMRAMDSHSDKRTFNRGEDAPSGLSGLVPLQSPATRQSSFNQRFTVNYKLESKKTQYTLGMNVDINHSENETRLPDELSGRNVSQQVTNYSPVLNIRHKLNKSNTLKFDYVGTMTSPSPSQLQDYTDVSNPVNSVKGNPDLKPQFNNSGMFTFSGSKADNQSYYNINLSGRYVANAIQPVFYINSLTGYQTTTYKNINGNWSVYSGASYHIPIKDTHFTVGYSLNNGYNRIKGYLNEEVSATSTFTTSQRPEIGYHAPDIDLVLRGLYVYKTIRGQTASASHTKTHDWGAEFRASCLLPLKIRFEPSFHWTLKRGYGESGDIRENILNVTLSRECFSKKYGTGTVQLSGYDLLQSRKQISRSIGSSFIQDTRTSVMGSYFMCSFVYSFNYFP